MEDHFDRIFATDGGSHGSDSVNKRRYGEEEGREGSGRGKGQDHQQFIRANSFHGRKLGYIFQRGPHGLGYYFDQYQLSSPSSSLSDKPQQEGGDLNKKRKLDHQITTAGPATASSSTSLSVEKILEESEQNEIEILNPVTLTKVFLTSSPHPHSPLPCAPLISCS